MSRTGTIVWKARPADGTGALDLLHRSDGDGIYLAQPDRGIELAGVGVAAAIESTGPPRFSIARAAAASIFARVVCDAPVAPMLFGGFAFHDDHAPSGDWTGFPSLRLVLPRRLVVRRGAQQWRVDVTGGCAPCEDAGAATAAEPRQDADDWHARVDRALADIAAGDLSKVVLSRSRSCVGADVDPISLVRRLREARPTCTTFLVRRAGAIFIGSTPEALASVQGGVARTLALAGSMRVEAGRSAEAVAKLLACPKNAAEHRFVAEAVRAGLARVGADVETTAARAIVTLPEMLHLATSHRARLRDGVSALDVAGVLHPTPAVGGVPVAAARARLAAEEPDRGWYAGGVGWVDANGEGDWSVALRCALVRGDRVRVFAGAGIVAGSEAHAEWDETEGKMAAMLRLLSERARAA